MDSIDEIVEQLREINEHLTEKEFREQQDEKLEMKEIEKQKRDEYFNRITGHGKYPW